MARETERSARSVEEALEAALEELGVTEQQVVVEVVQESRSGFLGVGGQEAIVRVRVKEDSGALEELEEQADAVADFIEEMLDRMGIDATAEPAVRGSHMYIDIEGEDQDDLALLIGKHGQTLEAIQELSRLVVGRRLDEKVRVIIDVEDYRKRRDSKLVERAQGVARRVAGTGREEELEPMNPYERKLVHDAVAELGGVESSSRGEEPNRAVVIRKR